MNLLTALSDFFKKNIDRFPAPHLRVLVGVSGGPDSISLLHAISQLKQEYQIEIEAAHLNHQIRGAEAEADANFVADFSAGLQIPCHLTTVNVPEMARKLSLIHI